MGEKNFSEWAQEKNGENSNLNSLQNCVTWGAMKELLLPWLEGMTKNNKLGKAKTGIFAGKSYDKMYEALNKKKNSVTDNVDSMISIMKDYCNTNRDRSPEKKKYTEDMMNKLQNIRNKFKDKMAKIVKSMEDFYRVDETSNTYGGFISAKNFLDSKQPDKIITKKGIERLVDYMNDGLDEEGKGNLETFKTGILASLESKIVKRIIANDFDMDDLLKDSNDKENGKIKVREEIVWLGFCCMNIYNTKIECCAKAYATYFKCAEILLQKDEGKQFVNDESHQLKAYKDSIDKYCDEKKAEELAKKIISGEIKIGK